MKKNEPKAELIMPLLTPILRNGAIPELKRSSQLEPKATDTRRNTVDLRHHMTFVGRIYQVSGAGSADGHYCPFCYDSGGKFARMHRNTNHWQCCVCEAVFYD
jgi:hypothetical protein